MSATDDFLAEARRAYLAANRATLAWMLDRPRQMGAFLDTKLNSVTLADYGVADGWRGPGFLYGWIQGRGLEALATHAAFFAAEDTAFAARLDEAGRALYGALKALHDRYGAAFFVYDETLRPIIPDAEGRPVPQITGSGIFTYSDAFVLKGLIAAASRYDPASRPAYLKRLAALVAAIEAGGFVMDEARPLDAAAASSQPPEFGPRMIVLGAAALLVRLGLADAAAFGDRFIAHVLTHHCDRAGAQPTWLIRDAVGGDRCNVGHAMEFSGFALDYLPKSADPATIDAIGRIILAAFRRGFTPPGLSLFISARTGERLSPYFPWWSLPETIRAAALACTRGVDLLPVWQSAHLAFFTHYWRGTPPIAYQTRTLEGPMDYVPATPDLDPGYHTGLSLLGAIEAIDAMRK